MRILYKGSSKKIDIIKPEPVHATDLYKLRSIGCNAKKVVWATSDKENAFIYAAFSRLISFFIDYSDNKRKVFIEDVDWKRKLKFDRKVYLYQLNPRGFIKVNEREYICITDVSVLKFETLFVKDIIKKVPNIYVPSKFPKI